MAIRFFNKALIGVATAMAMLSAQAAPVSLDYSAKAYSWWGSNYLLLSGHGRI